MGPKEKYNIIVNTIEELAQGKVHHGIIENIKAHDISNRAFSAAGCSTMDDRSKNVLFLFLLGQSVKDYIEERKMMTAYKILISSNSWNKETIWSAIDILGVSDEKVFAKKFKKQFNITPKKAFETKDMSLFTNIKDWDAISSEGKSLFINLGSEHMVETKFGISKESFMLAQVAANLQIFYNLNDTESELAFNLHSSNSFPLEDTFEYVYNYVWSYIDEESDERDCRLIEDLTNPAVLYMYFSCGMSFNEIIIVLHTLENNELPRKLETVSKNYLLGFRVYCKNDKYRQLQKSWGCKYTTHSYDEMYEYYEENCFDKESTELYLKYIEYAFNENLSTALCWAQMDIFDTQENHYECEDEAWEDEEIWGNIEDPYFNNDEYDYEPDFDDMDFTSDAWMSHKYLEQRNSYLNLMEERARNDFNLKSFEIYCDSLDSDEDISTTTTRKLLGYKSLDTRNIGN